MDDGCPWYPAAFAGVRVALEVKRIAVLLSWALRARFWPQTPLPMMAALIMR